VVSIRARGARRLALRSSSARARRAARSAGGRRHGVPPTRSHVLPERDRSLAIREWHKSPAVPCHGQKHRTIGTAPPDAIRPTASRCVAPTDGPSCRHGRRLGLVIRVLVDRNAGARRHARRRGGATRLAAAAGGRRALEARRRRSGRRRARRGARGRAEGERNSQALVLWPALQLTHAHATSPVPQPG
jgi:hypothetical protein